MEHSDCSRAARGCSKRSEDRFAEATDAKTNGHIKCFIPWDDEEIIDNSRVAVK